MSTPKAEWTGRRTQYQKVWSLILTAQGHV